MSADQFKFVVLNSSRQLALTGLGVQALGVLQDDPAAQGRAGSVMMMGISKIILSETIATGAPVAADAAGLAAVPAVGERIVGTCVRGGAVNEVGEVLLGNIGEVSA